MAINSEIKVLGAPPSPFVNRVRIALNLKSIKYEFLLEKFGVKSELLLKSNPIYKKIPVLIHGDKALCESLIIIEYVDQVWTNGPSILPSDPYDRAIAKFWATYVDDKLIPSLKGVRMEEGEAKLEAIERSREGLTLMEETFIKISKGKPFFGGENIGYLDIAIGSYIGWTKAAEIIGEAKLIDENKIPNLTKWVERFSTHEAVKDVVPEVDYLVGIGRMLKGMKH